MTPTSKAERTVTRRTPDGPPAHGAQASSGGLRGWRRLWPLAAIGAAMAAFYLSGLHETVSLATIIREREALAAAVEANILAVGAAYLGIYAVAVALSFPGASLITIAGGFLLRLNHRHGAHGRRRRRPAHRSSSSPPARPSARR